MKENEFIFHAGTKEYNSKVFSKYKENLESLRTEQASLKGLTQGFYLNVNRNTIKDSIDKITSSFSNMNTHLGELFDLSLIHI